MGRPPFAWSDDLEREMLDRIASGESVMDICSPDRGEHIPSERTFYKHLSEDETFAQEYVRVREIQGHREADEIRKIADAATSESYNVARLQIDARKWRASKMAPKVYGDKLDLNHSGSFTVNLESDADDL